MTLKAIILLKKKFSWAVGYLIIFNTSTRLFTGGNFVSWGDEHSSQKSQKLTPCRWFCSKIHKEFQLINRRYGAFVLIGSDARSHYSPTLTKVNTVSITFVRPLSAVC